MVRPRLASHHQPAVRATAGEPRSVRESGVQHASAPLPSGVQRARNRQPPSGLPFALAFLLLGSSLSRLTQTFAAEGPASDASALPGPLSRQLQDHLAQPEFTAATWGIRIARLENDATLFETNAHKLLKPASCGKLFTAALALDQLGPAHRIRTDLIPRGVVRPDGSLLGDLVVLGRGDFSRAARFLPPDSDLDPLQPFVEALTRAGIRRIEGAVVADDSLFGGSTIGTGWTWDDLRYYYGAEVSALTVDDNVVDLELTPGASEGDPVRLVTRPTTDYLRFDTSELRTGAPRTPSSVEVRRLPGTREVRISGRIAAGDAVWKDAVPVPEPGGYFASRLHRQLEMGGIRVRDGWRHGPGEASGLPAPSPFPPRIAVESRPIAELVPAMLKPSQNLYAQLLLLRCGELEPAKSPDEDLASRGLRGLRRFLDRAGISPAEVQIDDGSGLSRSSLVTPAALVQLLRSMDGHSQREIFFGGLPVAGVDGTLRTRLRRTPAEGNLRAKTGSLRYVNTLSGCVTNAAGHRLVFALMLNAYQPPPGGRSGREALDVAAELIARSRE